MATSVCHYILLLPPHKVKHFYTLSLYFNFKIVFAASLAALYSSSVLFASVLSHTIGKFPTLSFVPFLYTISTFSAFVKSSFCTSSKTLLKSSLLSPFSSCVVSLSLSVCLSTSSDLCKLGVFFCCVFCCIRFYRYYRK